MVNKLYANLDLESIELQTKTRIFFFLQFLAFFTMQNVCDVNESNRIEKRKQLVNAWKDTFFKSYINRRDVIVIRLYLRITCVMLYENFSRSCIFLCICESPHCNLQSRKISGNVHSINSINSNLTR